MSHGSSWSPTEKKVARSVFDAALQSELAELIAQVRETAATLSTADELWDLQELLHRRRREISDKYDYRYPWLELLFVWLLRERRIALAQLQGLEPERLARIESALAEALCDEERGAGAGQDDPAP
ncbi:MAG: hypothetical protein ACLGJD_16140 [Gammaproteobacteria bacterium]